MKYTEEKQSAIIAWYRYNRQTKTQTVYMLFHQRPKSKFHNIKPLTFENKKKNFFLKLIFHLPLKIFYPVLKEGDSSLKESKIEQNKWENKPFCSDMFAISHCALILVNSNRESCNVRLTAATHIRTYTINNTHTSSTDSKHNILQFDLAKKG